MKTVNIILGLLLISVLSSGSCVYGADVKVVFPKLKGYEIVKDYPVYIPDNLWDYINGGADAYLNYGFTDLHIAEYVKGENRIKVEVYHHKNNVYAYGMYALERSPDYQFIDLGIQGYAENSLVNFVKGPWYVKVSTYTEDKKTGDLILKLANNVEKGLEGRSKIPEVLDYFPKEEKILNSESFIADNYLGYSFLNEVYTSGYKHNDKPFVVFILSPKNIEKSEEIVENLLSKAKSSTVLKEGIVSVEDPYNGTILIKRIEKSIFGCMGNEDPDLFNNYINKMLGSMAKD